MGETVEAGDRILRATSRLPGAPGRVLDVPGHAPTRACSVHGDRRVREVSTPADMYDGRTCIDFTRLMHDMIVTGAVIVSFYLHRVRKKESTIF